MESFDWAFKAYAEGAIFCAFDTETTGLDPEKDRIVEFGAVKFDRNGPITRFSALVDPGVPMPAEASRVNNITDAMLAGKPPVEAVMPDFLRLIEGTIIIAHNAAFDCGFINQTLARISGGLSRGLSNRSADTLSLAKRFFPGLGRYNLQDLAAGLGIRAADAHRAMDDARLCMEIFIKCFAQTHRAAEARQT
ncbi:MAG: 3'-5' exonuclease [Treponema sp.]|jgi:DNA polymerase-3 subunit epsilon|nr:3'-5' exonuclease [Treponema sp.]